MMIFITGATGLVGSFVCRKLLSMGFAIRAAKQHTSSLEWVSDIHEDIEWADGSILDILFLEECLKGVDIVIHCAGQVSFSKKDFRQMYQANVEGTANIVNTCLKMGPEKLLYVSSVAAVGRPVGKSIITEDTKWVNSALNSVYAKTKYLAELEVWRGSNEGLPAIIINPSVILGPGNWSKSSTRLFKYAWSQSPFYTEGTLNYVDVRDIANIIYQLTQTEISDERFIINAGKATYKHVFEKIAFHFDRKPPYIKAGSFLSRLALLYSSVRSFLTGCSPLLTRDTMRLGKQDIYFSNKKLLDTLDYTFYSLDETIAWTCSELKRHYELPEC